MYRAFTHPHTHHTPISEVLVVQRLLPEIAAHVRRRIHHLTNTRNVQVLNRSVVAVHVKVRHAGLVGVAGHGELGDVLLQGDGHSCIRDAGLALVGEVGVRDVLAVNGGRDAEEICVRLIAWMCGDWVSKSVKAFPCGGGLTEGFVEVERIATMKRSALRLSVIRSGLELT